MLTPEETSEGKEERRQEGGWCLQQLTGDFEEELVPDSVDHAAFLQQAPGHHIVEVDGDDAMVVDDHGRTAVRQVLQPVYLKS